MTLSETSPRGSTSASLLRRLRQPTNQIAWERFVHLYTPLMFHWVRKTGLDYSDCADLVQDVFHILVRKLPTFEYDPAKSFRAWLKTVVLNTWHNRLRQRKVEVRDDLDDMMPPQSRSDDFIDLEEAEYRQHLVARAVELMKSEFEPITWQACWQLAVLGRSGAEIARELNISVNSVYLAKSRVLARLRRELEGLLD